LGVRGKKKPEYAKGGEGLKAPKDETNQFFVKKKGENVFHGGKKKNGGSGASTIKG